MKTNPNSNGGFCGYVRCVFTILSILCFSVITITACNSGAVVSEDVPAATANGLNGIPPSEKLTTAYKIIPSLNGTFGYDVFVNGRVLIHQPNRPGLPGNEGFKTEEQATTVAEFVSKKIRNNEMPPTVMLEDLKMLGVLK